MIGVSRHQQWKRRSDGGVQFATALKRGTILAQDDCLVLPQLRLIVRVVEPAEPVLVVRPATPRDWALYAYQIGNSHQPIMLTDDALVCPDVPGVELLLQQHRMPYSRALRPFTRAATVAGHSH